MTYIEPRFGRVGVQDQRLPGDADRVRDARRLAASVSIRAITRSRPLHRRRVGQLHVEQQIALVLLRE